MQPERCLHRADLRRRRRDNVVARQCQFEATAEADAVNTRNQRDRQQFHEAEKLDTIQAPVLTIAVPTALRHALVENIEICAGRKMPKAAAQHDGAAAGVSRGFDLFDDGIDELRPEQIVRAINHGQDGNIAALLAHDQCILGHGMPPFSAQPCATVYLLRSAYNMTCKMQVMFEITGQLNYNRHLMLRDQRLAVARVSGTTPPSPKICVSTICGNASNASGPAHRLPDPLAASDLPPGRVARSPYRPWQASPHFRFVD
jgi:hypothetical protein